MKRTYRFVDSLGTVRCTLPGGEAMDIPLIPGLLKHSSADGLAVLLQDPHTLRKYTIEALRRAPWHVVRQFPRGWLSHCMECADLPEGRRNALIFLLSP